MRKVLMWLLLLSVFLTSCFPFGTKKRTGDAEEVLSEILETFSISDGVIYSEKEGAAYPLTDALLERMFCDEGDMADFAYVTSCAVYFSRHFSEREIVVLKLCDLSHQRELLRLLRKRAEKKENAVAFADGVYVYLICTDQNEEIKHYLE